MSVRSCASRHDSAPRACSCWADASRWRAGTSRAHAAHGSGWARRWRSWPCLERVWPAPRRGSAAAVSRFRSCFRSRPLPGAAAGPAAARSALLGLGRLATAGRRRRAGAAAAQLARAAAGAARRRGRRRPPRRTLRCADRARHAAPRPHVALRLPRKTTPALDAEGQERARLRRRHRGAALDAAVTRLDVHGPVAAHARARPRSAARRKVPATTSRCRRSA